MVKRSSLVPWLWALTTVLVVVGVAGVLWWRFGGPDTGDGNHAGGSNPSSGPTTLPSGRDYYVWVKLIELTEKMPDGSRWDMDGSAPDVRFKLWFKGNLVQVSTTRRDSLIAKWEMMSADILEILRSGGTIEVSSVLKLPIVHVDPGMTLAIVIDDNDVGNGELAGEIEIPLDQLKVGENTLSGPSGSGVARVVVQLVDVCTPASDLVQIAVSR